MCALAMPQRCAAPSSSTLASATMLMPWWCAMKVAHRRERLAAGLARRREVERLDEAVARARAQRLAAPRSWRRRGAARSAPPAPWHRARSPARRAACGAAPAAARPAARTGRPACGRCRHRPIPRCPRARRCASAKAICSRSAARQASCSTLPCGSSSTSVGIRYSNIEPDHERRPASRADGEERPAERRPVAHRHVALGDRQQAGQARLRGQQVVEAGVELLLGDAVADVEQVALAVVQEAEVGLPGQLLAVAATSAAGAGPSRRPRCAGLRSRSAERSVARWSARRQAQSSRRVGARRRRLVARQPASQLGGGVAQQARRTAPASARHPPSGSAQREQARQRVPPGSGRRTRRAAARGAPRRARARAAQRRSSCGARASSRQACATASRWPLRLPLSTVDTYIGSSGAPVCVSYQFRKWPRWRCSVGQRGQRGLQPRQQLLRADPAELPRAGHAQQVQADVGGRGAVRHHVVRRGLQVVGRQVVVLGADAALEQAPGVARDAFQVGAGRPAAARRRARAGRGRLTHQVHTGDARPQQAQRQRQRRVRRARGEQRGQQQQRHHRLAPVPRAAARRSRSWPAPARPRRWSTAAGGGG